MTLEVSEGTLRNWERGRAPHVASYPKIIEFLETDPWPVPETLPQKLRAARRRRGLNVAQAATALAVDPSTVWWWEAGRKPHLLEHRSRIAAFLDDHVGETASLENEGSVSEPTLLADGLGGALRRRRRDQGLTMEVAARAIGANVWTLLSWEHNRRIPTDRFYPALIRFLGYEPWPEPMFIGDRLRAERLRRGLTQEQAAAVVQVSPDSIADWEGGRHPHHHLSFAKIEAFLVGTVRPRARSGKHRRTAATKPSA